MTPSRNRSIVPMFGGGTNYVDTLDRVLSIVDAMEPTTSELVNWHRKTFSNVSSRTSIMRRVNYLAQMEFLTETENGWKLGEQGREYVERGEMEALLEIMVDRNVGLRSLLYALYGGSLDLGEISDQQLDTHPELGWSRGQTDMARQRVNWLESMEYIEQVGRDYELTDAGRGFVRRSVEDWARTDDPQSDPEPDFDAGTYSGHVAVRSVDPEFRAAALAQHESRCPISGVDHPGLLDVAHLLPWRDYPDHRGDLSNVMALSKTHHAAFDRKLFTIDNEYRMRINPDFTTESDLLNHTLINRNGDQISTFSRTLKLDYINRYNESLDWF